MGAIKKKGTSGEVTKFINRSKALKKLQISLKDFRRLCILKGIYPRVPKNKKKLSKGSSKLTTWYYKKDIQFLLHEPLLQKFRDWKAYAKKLTRFREKKEWDLLDAWAEKEPQFKLDHIIRERYPTFQDALQDLDDALSMICLFATLPQLGRHVTSDFILECQQKRNHFFHYISHFHLLKKAFVSIKGIYFQATLPLGQGTGRDHVITWVMPHPFAPSIPKDVDFKILLSFAQLYDCLLGFVLFKLYNDAEWRYPPSQSIWPTLEEQNNHVPCTSEVASSVPLSSTTKKTTSKEQGTLDTFVPLKPTVPGHSGDILPTLASPMSPSLVFQGLTFFLSRETNVEVLALVIRSLGGRVGWDATTTLDVRSPFPVTHPGITHHVLDRPLPTSSPAFDALPKRTFVQPQFVFDCLNQLQRLPVLPETLVGYAPGQRLPPHVSPFVSTADPWTYQPTAVSADGGVLGDNGNESGKEGGGGALATAAASMATMMMPKAHQRLYQRIMRTRVQKQKKMQTLLKKREVIEKLKARCGVVKGV